MSRFCCRRVYGRGITDVAGELAAVGGADVKRSDSRAWQQLECILALSGLTAGLCKILSAAGTLRQIVNDSSHHMLVGGEVAVFKRFVFSMRASGYPDEAGRIASAVGVGKHAGNMLLCRGRRLLLNRTRIMGILNVTPDSFSDGGKFALHDRAVEQALLMERDGAAVIDVGGESTRPGAKAVSARAEAQRVVPVIRTLSKKLKKSLISVDTCKSGVARAALDAGAHIVNDISGMRFDKKIAGITARAGAAAVLMHINGTPRTMQKNPGYGHLMHDVYRYLAECTARAADAGIAERSIAVDPGIGFGKTVGHNLELLRRLPELGGLGYPLLIGASRKSFIGLTLNEPVGERLEGSLAAAVAAVAGGARLIRTHDVKETCRAVKIADAIYAV